MDRGREVPPGRVVRGGQSQILQLREVRLDGVVLRGVRRGGHQRDVQRAGGGSRSLGPVRREVVVGQVDPTASRGVGPDEAQEPPPHSRVFGRREEPVHLVVVVVVHPEQVASAEGLRVGRPNSVGVPRPSPGAAAVRLERPRTHLVRRDDDRRVVLPMGERPPSTDLRVELRVVGRLPGLPGGEAHHLLVEDLPQSFLADRLDDLLVDGGGLQPLDGPRRERHPVVPRTRESEVDQLLADRLGEGGRAAARPMGVECPGPHPIEVAHHPTDPCGRPVDHAGDFGG